MCRNSVRYWSNCSITVTCAGIQWGTGPTAPSLWHVPEFSEALVQLLHHCVQFWWSDVIRRDEMYGSPRCFVFVFFICNSSRFCSFCPLKFLFLYSVCFTNCHYVSICQFLFLYSFCFTDCHNSRFHTHRMKCNNSSFRFRYANSSGLMSLF